MQRIIESIKSFISNLVSTKVTRKLTNAPISHCEIWVHCLPENTYFQLMLDNSHLKGQNCRYGEVVAIDRNRHNLDKTSPFLKLKIGSKIIYCADQIEEKRPIGPAKWVEGELGKIKFDIVDVITEAAVKSYEN